MISNEVLLLVVVGVFGVFFLLRRRNTHNLVTEVALLKERLSAKEVQLSEGQSKLEKQQQELQEAQTTEKLHLEKLSELRTQLENEKKLGEEKLKMLLEAQEGFKKSFKLLSSEALKENHQSFMDLAKSSLETMHQESKSDLDKRQVAINHLVKPLNDSLTKVDKKIDELEKSRTGAYESLNQQVKSLFETQNYLRQETSNLVKALRSPVVRGRWGEIQLKRVVELAGMLDHCDFYEQESKESDNGRLRPDLVVKLPGGKNIIVDSKAPLSAYLESLEQVDEKLRVEKLKDHARQIRTHIQHLSRKSYWDQFQPAPEFVVLFLPGETFFSAALEQDPSLIEVGVEQKVILATPTTLIALLRAVSYGWKQEHLTENAKQIGEIGKELYKRIYDMSRHISGLGKNIKNAVDSYNKTVGTFESRVLVSARRLNDMEFISHAATVEDPSPVENYPRSLQNSEELT